MNKIIDIDHADYEKVFAQYRKDRGTTFIYGGTEYIAVNDNDHVKFVEINSTSGIDGQYSKQSFYER